MIVKHAILLFSISSLILSLLTGSTAKLDSVRDIDGKKLLPGTEYYILPVACGQGGGLTLASRAAPCPLAVVQESSELAHGLPVTFSPVNATDKAVKLSTDLNVAFAAATICVQSTVWRLGGVDAATGERYVVTGGVKGKPGPKTLSNWFKIERAGGDYKLVFCPMVCNFCKVLCGDMGVFDEGGKRWLGLNGEPFPIKFKKKKKKKKKSPSH